MACRYLERRGDCTTCLASDPTREPSLAERRTLCETDDSRACPFHRFHRAAGRPLRLEDHAAWQKRQAAQVPQELPSGRPLVLPTMMPLRPPTEPQQQRIPFVDLPETLQ